MLCETCSDEVQWKLSHLPYTLYLLLHDKCELYSSSIWLLVFTYILTNQSIIIHVYTIPSKSYCTGIVYYRVNIQSVYTTVLCNTVQEQENYNPVMATVILCTE